MRGVTVAVLMGGPSSEHAISMMSGEQIARALEARWTVIEVVLDPDGGWRFDGEATKSLGAALDRLGADAQVAFPALHGAFGEDGTVQALLETLGLPYVGSGVGASALAMDKARAKRLYGSVGLPSPSFVHLVPDDLEVLPARLASAPWPCVVKPSAAGSSVGVRFPDDRSATEDEVRQHLRSGCEVVVEAVVRGRELTCGVLEFEDGPRALPVTEIIPGDAYAFFDYTAKYTPGATREVTPAEIPDDLRETAQTRAVAAHRALGCRDLSRTDFMVEDGQPVLLETNTLPGFTSTSLLPQAAAEAGLAFGELVDHLVGRALARGP